MGIAYGFPWKLSESLADGRKICRLPSPEAATAFCNESICGAWRPKM